MQKHLFLDIKASVKEHLFDVKGVVLSLRNILHCNVCQKFVIINFWK